MMIDARRLTEDFTAAPQIDPEDVPALKAAGFTHIVNNRPDSEVPPSHQADRMAEAAAAAGIGYTAIPVSPAGIAPADVDRMAAVLAEAPGPVFAWCRSGTRSTNLWALAEATRGRDASSLVEAAAKGGYDVSGLIPALDSLSNRAR